jgi:hypothetical protein
MFLIENVERQQMLPVLARISQPLQEWKICEKTRRSP